MTDEPTLPEEDEDESLFRFIGGLLFTTVLLLTAAAVVLGAAGNLMGYYRIEIVLSGSMRPDYDPGSVIVAFAKPKEEVQTGDVIVFRSPPDYGGDTITHRVVTARLTDNGDVYVQTKGDANPVPDPWDARISTEEVWVVERGIPYVGYVAYHAQQWWPLLLALGISIPMMSFANGRVRETYGKGTRRGR